MKAKLSRNASTAASELRQQVSEKCGSACSPRPSMPASCLTYYGHQEIKGHGSDIQESPEAILAG